MNNCPQIDWFFLTYKNSCDEDPFNPWILSKLNLYFEKYNSFFFNGINFSFLFLSSLVRKFFYRIENKFRSPAKPPFKSPREIVTLPGECLKISVEMALNSRCTSDYDGNPKRFHWGMFDPERKLSKDQI